MFEIVDLLKKQGAKPSTPTDNLILAQRLRAGDKEAERTFIERNIYLLSFFVHRFTKKNQDFKHLQDDLLSEGILTLVKLPQVISRSNYTNLQSFIINSLHNALKDLIRKESRHIDIEELTREISEQFYIEPLKQIDLKCDLKTLSPKHSPIIPLMCRGFTRREVANLVSCSIRTVNRRLKRLENLLEKAYATD